MQTVSSIINQHAEKQPEATFLIQPETDQSISFADLKRNIDDIARHLDGLGIHQGSKVAFMLDNGIWSASFCLESWLVVGLLCP